MHSCSLYLLTMITQTMSFHIPVPYFSPLKTMQMCAAESNECVRSPSAVITEGHGLGNLQRTRVYIWSTALGLSSSGGHIGLSKCFGARLDKDHMAREHECGEAEEQRALVQ